MTKRVNLSKAAPALYKGVAQLATQLTQELEHAGIDKGFGYLLRLRASQINHCGFCCRMHTQEARDCGEPEDRIAVLPCWRETEYFSPKERAALALVEAITLIAEGQVPDAVYDSAAEVLSDDEINAIEWLAIVINAWNRIAITSRYRIAPAK